MKKLFQRYWQLLILPALYMPYKYLNERVIVEWLGCGCPKLGPQGEMIESGFNANDFTLIFWGAVALAVIIISLFNVKQLTKWYHKLLYMVLISAGSLFVALQFYYSMQWR